MGRTFRIRRLKKRQKRPVSIANDAGYVRFIRWLTVNGWRSVCSMTPAVFQETGRGLMAKERIQRGGLLVQIPANLLITAQTVSLSSIGHLFTRGEDARFSVQQVLSCYLVWERHLGRNSFWWPYLTLLPEEHSSPVFSSETVFNALPGIVKNKALIFRANANHWYDAFVSLLTPSDICQHCQSSYADIFTPEAFNWAWFTVNSRSVYLSPTVGGSHRINLSDANTLALAPFLDMINHKDTARVNVCFDSIENTYNVVTTTPYSKHDEVFINYGGHANLKLLIEYGFIISGNVNDSVEFTPDEVLAAAEQAGFPSSSLAKPRYNFLKTHNFLKDLQCTNDGLSWNLRVLLYVMTSSTIELGPLLKNIYCSKFSASCDNVNSVVNYLFTSKINELKEDIKKLEIVSNHEGKADITSFTMSLLREYITIMENNL